MSLPSPRVAATPESIRPHRRVATFEYIDHHAPCQVHLEAIRDCLHRYCRGIDRADEAALRSCYWPDATDNHGSYSGSAGGFIQLALSVFKTQPRNIHQLANIMIEFLGPAEAAVESYFTALQRGPDEAGEMRQMLLCGRYCDLFQKREGEWRISERTVVYDWVEEQRPPTSAEAERFGPRQPIGAPHPNDPVYELLKRHAPLKTYPKIRVGGGEEE